MEISVAPKVGSLAAKYGALVGTNGNNGTIIEAVMDLCESIHQILPQNTNNTPHMLTDKNLIILDKSIHDLIDNENILEIQKNVLLDLEKMLASNEIKSDDIVDWYTETVSNRTVTYMSMQHKVERSRKYKDFRVKMCQLQPGTEYKPVSDNDNDSDGMVLYLFKMIYVSCQK
jgi:hypothetical protein